jgi:TonB-dependent starch-binding outer membrane protein SusC
MKNCLRPLGFTLFLCSLTSLAATGLPLAGSSPGNGKTKTLLSPFSGPAGKPELRFFPGTFNQAPQQAIEITGKVTSASGEALPGVTVMVKGTSVATATNENGSFTLRIPARTGTLVFTYIGYTPQEVPITQATVYTIKMVEDSQLMREIEIVNIGYGTALRNEVTGSIGSVNMEDINKAPVRSLDEALAGRVAGVQVVSADGQPGTPATIIIRGASSLTQDNSPLYVIDGFPTEDAQVFNAIPPADIESTEILRDVAATAIYGSRGANGVILITTKKGRVGLPTVNYNAYYGVQESRKRMGVLSPYDFVKLQNELDPQQTTNLYYKGKGPDGRDLTLEDYRNIKPFDWEDEVMRTAPMQNHTLSLRGGTDKTLYNVSATYFNQEGILINSGFDRYQARLSLDQEVSSKVKIGVNTSYSQYKSYGTPPSADAGSGQANLLYSVWAFRPVSASGLNLLELETDPEVQQNDNYSFNPILTSYNEVRDNNFETLIGNAYGEYTILKGLKFKLSGGIIKSTREFEVFNGPQSRSAQTNNRVNGGITTFNSTQLSNQGVLTYDKKFNGNHSVTVLGGYELLKSTGKAFGASAIILPNANLGVSGLDEGTVNSLTSSSTEWTMASFFSRAAYTFKYKYVINATFRADGSSKFAPGSKWGYFPSVSGLWHLGKEPFMKSISLLSGAKINAGWGLSGNNRVGDFPYASKITLPQDASYYFGNQPTTGSYSSDLGNSALKWENTQNVNLGMDLSFFQDRASVKVEVYRKATRDLLLNAYLPTSTGYSRATKNIGRTRNDGLEVTLDLDPIRGKEFRWNTNFNISFNRNQVVGLSQNEERILTPIPFDYAWLSIPAYIAKLNQPVAQFYGLIWDGVYTYDDFDRTPSGGYSLKETVTTNGAARSNIRPGDIKYRDINGDRTINDFDKTVIGNPLPVHIGGFTNNFQYKGFELNVMFQWSYGNDILNANRIYLEAGSRYGINQFATFADRWTEENPESNIPRARGQVGLTTYSSRVIEDGSFLRLKTVRLAYNVPAAIIDRVKVKNLQVYASAQNLYTWTNYTGYDPEVSVRPSALTPGFDYSAYPRAVTTTLGLNVTF